MKTSPIGISLIKQFEGCRLTAYKPVPTEQYWTIGYGHYGADVTPGMRITQSQAEAFLKTDLAKFEQAVERTFLPLNQNQFDALVSFAYNCGVGNLKKLVDGRTLPQIANKMLSYNKAGGKVLSGLVRRREAERTLFLSGSNQGQSTSETLVTSEPKNGNPYKEPTKNVKYNSRGNDVRWLQYALNNIGHYGLVIDGIFKDKTKQAVIDFQKKAFPDKPEEWDGIVGIKTRMAINTATEDKEGNADR